MISITIRDKKVAQEDSSPYLVIVKHNATSYVAYETIEEFLDQWHDTLKQKEFKVFPSFDNKSLVLMADWDAVDVYPYRDELDELIRGGARPCRMLSNGTMHDGAVKVDETMQQTVFFRLNANDKGEKKLI